MVPCPRCGAENPPDKSACWKCWAPLAPAPPPNPELAAPVRRQLSLPNLSVAFPWRRARPAPETDESPTVELTETAVLPDEPPREAEEAPQIEDDPEPEPVAEVMSDPEPVEPVPSAPEPEPLPPVEAINEVELAPEPEIPRPVVDEAAPTEDAREPEAVDESEDAPPEEEGIFVQNMRSYSYIAPLPPDVGRRRSEIAIVAVAVLLFVSVVGLMLYWYYGNRARPVTAMPGSVAKQYIFALRMGNSPEQQQLALDRTRGLHTPPWFLVTDAQLAGPVVQKRDFARVPVRLILVAPQPEELAGPVRRAAGDTYTVSLPLIPVRDGWRVEQRAFFRNLRIEMKRRHPNTPLPPWRGISE